MPTIQQEHGQKTVKGLPLRWGRRAYRELSEGLTECSAAKRAFVAAQAEPGRLGPGNEELQYAFATGRYANLSRMLDEVTAAPVPVDATDAHLCVLAERYASDCATHGAIIHDPRALRERLAFVCRVAGITPPQVRDDMQAIMRCNDPTWWRRSLRRVHGRTFEAAALRLGFVSVRAGMYASDETVARRQSQVARNRAALESVKIRNEDGYECTLAEAASKTTSNKRIRRGELMLRLAGCEDVAIEAGHVGVFVTLTAPSKYHAVLQKSGVVNPRYNDATPREVQAYLQKTWARIRAAYGRYGIRPYGFRIAEPHHDGCVHWHALVFMRAAEVDWFCSLVEKYALAEDGDEPGAQANRVQFERIDSAKGSAAAYIAKYISKNIDDDSEAAHDEVIGPDGEPVKIAMPADETNRASQRVDAWAGVWGIRQFQPIGQPPVTVWRELRRVAEAEVQNACPTVRAAWDAAQRVEHTDADGEITVERVASFGNYIRAQGGVCMGRDYAIGIKHEAARVEGRYGVYDGMAPAGVFAKAAPLTVYSSTRYSWTRVQAGVAVASPWSPVNNCTEPGRRGFAPAWASDVLPGEPMAEFDDAWFRSDEYQKIFVPPEVAGDEWHAAEVAATDQRARTVWTEPSYAHRTSNT